MAKEWPCLSNVQHTISSQVLTVAIKWRSEDMKHHQPRSYPAYEEKISDSIAHQDQRSVRALKTSLVTKLQQAFGKPKGLGYLGSKEKLQPGLVEGTWRELVESLEALFRGRAGAPN